MEVLVRRACQPEWQATCSYGRSDRYPHGRAPMEASRADSQLSVWRREENGRRMRDAMTT